MARGLRASVLLVLAALLVTTVGSLTPAAPAGAALAPRAFTQVDSSGSSTCGVAADGGLWCWGSGNSSNPSTGAQLFPQSWIPVQVSLSGTPLAGKRIAQVSVGGNYQTGNHACALATDGALACWGYNVYGQLGDGTRTNRTRPTAVQTAGTPLAGRRVTKVTAGKEATCALADNAALACWGTGNLTATNTTGNRLVPTGVTRSGSALNGKTVVDVALAGEGNPHGCAVSSDGTAACWGHNYNGQLGNGATLSVGTELRAVPVRTAGTALAGKRFTQISVGGRSPYHYANTCARTSDGLAACWGYNAQGQLGNGSTTSSAVPTLVRTAGTVLSGKQVRQVLAVGITGCAVTTDGLVSCWGGNWDGLLGVAGRSTSQPSSTPLAVSRTGTALAGASVTALAGGESVCARATDGRLACWGKGASGQLGDGYRTTSVNHFRDRPVAVVGTGPFGVFSSNAAFVDRAWRDLMGRPPTASERTRWVGDLDARRTTPGGVVAFLRASGDHATRVDPVARLYWAYFVRRPDASGLQYWVDRRRGGATLQSISIAFAGSTEFRERYGSLSNGQFVDLIYRNILGRAPDAPGRAHWVGQLDRGGSRGTVMLGFSESPEYKAKQARAVHAVVLHTFLLRRTLTQAELDASVSRLGSGGTVAQEGQRILDSSEYAQRILDIR